MSDPLLQPVSRDQVMKLAEGRAGMGERRQIVRRLVAQAARNQVTASLYPDQPAPEASYDLALKRAFERACQLHEQLGSEHLDEELVALAPFVGGYSTSEPSARRA